MGRRFEFIRTGDQRWNGLLPLAAMRGL